MIISVSRRTDIVAFYMPWFMNKIRDGKACYYNPFNYKGYEISLKPKDVDVLVFISKNFSPLLPYLDELKSSYNLYFHYTITGLTGIFEDNVPEVGGMIKTFHELSHYNSPDQVDWRFDPIILSNITPPEFYLKKFKEIGSALEGKTFKCYFSFATIYNKVKRSFQQLEEKKGIRLLDADLQLKYQLAEELATLAKGFGMQLYNCCNELTLPNNIEKAKCINGEYLGKLFDLDKTFANYPTRKGCGCVKCVDVGVYDTCPHGCSYCYANKNKQAALKNYSKHSPEDELLVSGKIEIVKRISK